MNGPNEGKAHTEDPSERVQDRAGLVCGKPLLGGEETEDEAQGDRDGNGDDGIAKGAQEVGAEALEKGSGGGRKARVLIREGG